MMGRRYSTAETRRRRVKRVHREAGIRMKRPEIQKYILWITTRKLRKETIVRKRAVKSVQNKKRTMRETEEMETHFEDAIKQQTTESNLVAAKENMVQPMINSHVDKEKQGSGEKCCAQKGGVRWTLF